MLNIHFGRENIDMDALIINPMVYFKYNKNLCGSMIPLSKK